MITFEQFQQQSPKPTKENYEAFVRMCRAFNAADCESYAEGKEKILISMNFISEELELVEDSSCGSPEVIEVFDRHCNAAELNRRF